MCRYTTKYYIYIQARRQGGFEGVQSNPPFGLQKISYTPFDCILSSLSFENGPLVLLLLRITAVQTNLVVAVRVCSWRTSAECACKLFAPLRVNIRAWLNHTRELTSCFSSDATPPAVLPTLVPLSRGNLKSADFEHAYNDSQKVDTIQYSTSHVATTARLSSENGLRSYLSSSGSRGVPWVPWNPSFEGLPSKNTTYYVDHAHTGATHFSFTVAITHVCQLNNFLYQEFDAHMAYVHV